MTDAELCRSFMESKKRKRQIKILSELTLRPMAEIRAVLAANGIDPDAPAPKPSRRNYEMEGCGIALPSEIRKEVFEYDFHSSFKRRAKRC